MTVTDGQIREAYSGAAYTIRGQRTQVSVPGAVGEAWRTDGYSSYVKVPVAGRIPNTGLGVNMRDSVIDRLTISFWMAVETYPLMTTATQDFGHPLYTMVIGNINDSLHTGFAFELSNVGTYRFRCYSSGWLITTEPAPGTRMPLSEWQHIIAIFDGYNQELRLYNNGCLMCSTRTMYDISLGTTPLLLGKCEKDILDGMFALNYFNGLIDEVRIDPTIWSAQRIASELVPEHPADMDLPTELAYGQDLCRPRYHGMPTQNWTNESHGMTYSGGRYHIFFQKNGAGPMMSKLHWGHISSPDMFHWHEEPVAMIPYESYDIKGCWSGCLFNDHEVTGGQTWAIYSAIDDGHCEMIFSNPLDDSMRAWNKQGYPRLRCSFPDDFRDPYFFRHNGRPYIIAGCADRGLGIATLHPWNGDVWLSEHEIFFKADALADAGSFWEMPTITPIDGRWLFTVTPMSTSLGVRTLYWTGNIDGGGHFVPDNMEPYTVELPGLAREGFGLLSPTIMQKDGKTIALGIAPDKVSSTLNYTLGYAHCYSFPREWRLEGDRLMQRPYSGLHDLRTDTAVVLDNITLNGARRDLSPIMGRSVELKASWTLTNDTVGFVLLRNTYGGMKVYIDPATSSLVVDMTTISRRANDNGVFSGIYRSVIPSGLWVGGEVTLDVFYDHSVLDVFVNDSYASTIRLFPYDFTANGCDIYSTGNNPVRHVEAYGLGKITHYTKQLTDDLLLYQPAAAQKYIQNGTLFIQRGAHTYDAAGHSLR